VIIPSENEKDLADIPDNVLKGLKIIPVSDVEDVLKNALVRMPKAITWEEPPETPHRAGKGDEDHEGVVAH
jgi:ATP-dependent Lon protease